MRHRRAGYRLTRTSSHRNAMLRNIAAGLFEHGQITTTIPKAKDVQPMVEKIVTLAKRGDLDARRLVIAKLGGDRRGSPAVLAKRAGDAEKEAVNALRERACRFFGRRAPEQRGGAEPLRELRKAPKLTKHIFENVSAAVLGAPGRVHADHQARSAPDRRRRGALRAPVRRPTSRVRRSAASPARGGGSRTRTAYAANLRKGDALRPSRGVRQSRRASPGASRWAARSP